MGASPYLQAARAAAAKYGIPEGLLLRQVNAESGWNPRATSPAGAMGLLQLMPATARSLGVSDPYNPLQNLDAGARYLADQYKRFGSWKDALAAYNAGPGRVVDGSWQNIPETVRYVDGILQGLQTQQPAPAVGHTSPTGSHVAPQGQQGMSLGDMQILEELAGGGTPSDAQLLSLLSGGRQAALADPLAQQTRSLPSKSMGSFKAPVVDLTSVGGMHQTEGLPGYPAHDYFAPSGSAVVAPITGRIIKLSGHDPAQGPVEGPHGPLGWSVYIQAPDGHIYYLTHMGSRSVHLGQTVKAGQSIGTVADYAKYGTPSHIHMGVH